MSQKGLPKIYLSIKNKHGRYIAAIEELGRALKEEGPLDAKTAQLVQLAAAATIRSEGAVHSHTKRAIEAGARPDEIYHALIL